MKFPTLSGAAVLSSVALGAAIPRPLDVSVNHGRSWMTSSDFDFDNIVVVKEKDSEPAVAVILPSIADISVSIGTISTKAEEYYNWGHIYFACFRGTAADFAAGAQRFVDCNMRAFEGHADAARTQFARHAAPFTALVDVKYIVPGVLDLSTVNSRDLTLQATVDVALNTAESVDVAQVDVPKVETPPPPEVETLPTPPNTPTADATVEVTDGAAPESGPAGTKRSALLDDTMQFKDIDSKELPTAEEAEAKLPKIEAPAGLDPKDKMEFFLPVFSTDPSFLHSANKPSVPV